MKGYVYNNKCQKGDGFCHTKKQTKINFLGTERIVGCVCKCGAEKLQQEKKQFEEEENLRRIAQLRSAGLQDKAFYGYTFEKCDGTKKNTEYAYRYVEHFSEMKERR